MENNYTAQVLSNDVWHQEVKIHDSGLLQYIVKYIVHAPNCGSTQGAPLVFIHGWGSDSRVWQVLLEALQGFDDFPFSSVICIDLPGFGCNADLSIHSLSQLLDEIQQVLPQGSHLVGWSLGGMLATQLVAKAPNKYASLITLATNAKFCVADDWPFACEHEVYQAFYQGFAEQPALTLQRFMQLQAKGDKKRKQVVSSLRGLDMSLSDENLSTWIQGLSWLDELDNREVLNTLSVPHLSILGEHDALVPSEFSTITAASDFWVVEGAGHAPHLSQAGNVAQKFIDFWRGLSSSSVSTSPPASMPSTQHLREKTAVAESFSRAAESYDTMADLQRRVATRMLSMHADYQGTLCDLGSGTGFCLDSVKALQGSDGETLGLDIAEGMLEYCRKKTPNEQKTLICGDIENLPFADNACDGLFSSMSIQWCESIDAVCQEAARVLKPGGWFLASTLGPNTLHELRSAWRSVDEYVHINQFEDIERVQEALTEAGFTLEKELCDIEVLQYQQVMELMRELKGIGAHNVNAGKNKGLTPRRKFQQLDAAYETYRKDGILPASYEVYYFLARAHS